MFSCATEFMRDSFSRRDAYRGYTVRENRNEHARITGATASRRSVSAAFTLNRYVMENRNRQVLSTALYEIQHTVWRTMSRSPVRRVIRSPVRYRV